MATARLSPRQRFLTALRGGQPDRVPIFDWVNNPALYREVLGADPGFYDGGLAVRLARGLGLDAAWVPAGGFMGLPSPRWHWLDDARYIDEWGTGYQLAAGSWPLAFPRQHPVRTRPDWERIAGQIPDAEADWQLDLARQAIAEAHSAAAGSSAGPAAPAAVGASPSAADGPGAGREAAAAEEIAVVAGVRGPFSSAWMLMGLEQMSFALADDPALLAEIFAASAAFWARLGERLAASGVDALVVHDDQGSGTGTFFAPARFRSHVLPHLRRQIAALAATGVPVVLHSCGNINAILPDLAGTGICGLNNLQRSSGMDIAAVKATYGSRLCLIGNVDATNLMPYASPAEIAAAVAACIQVAGSGGGYVLATDHSFHEGIPTANVHAFIAAGRQYGRYSR